jgi:hypothetical protein
MLRGKDGVVRAGPDALASVQSWTLDEEVDTVSGWGMGDDAETTFGTVKRFMGSFEVYTKDTGPNSALRPGVAEVPLELYPGGEGSGSGYFSGTVIITTRGMSGSKDGIPTTSFNFKGTGALSQATVA